MSDLIYKAIEIFCLAVLVYIWGPVILATLTARRPPPKE